MLKCAWGTFGTANPGKLGGRAASHKRYPLNLPPSMRSELICRHCAVTGSGISSPATAPAGTTTSVESPYHTRPAPKHPTVPTSRPPDGRLQAGAVSLGARLEIQRISRYIEFQGTTRQRGNGGSRRKTCSPRPSSGQVLPDRWTQRKQFQVVRTATV